MNRRTVLLTPLLLSARSGAAQGDNALPPELYRVRVSNTQGGAVEISTDAGMSWEPLGKVTRAASVVSPAGLAAGVAAPGAVAGVGPRIISIRVPRSSPGSGLLRIACKGEAPDPSTIATDLERRSCLFRLLAPPIGSEVLLERQGSMPLPVGYAPRSRDLLHLVVRRTAHSQPVTLTLENRVDGEVILHEPDTTPRLLGTVRQPIRGIGRYDGTERAGAGAIVAWSPTNLVVSTADLRRKLNDQGEVIQDRGGIVIQPVEPNLQGATHPASQMLVEAVEEMGSRPPISRLFGYPGCLSTGDPLDLQSARCDARIDGGEWAAIPNLRGTVEEAGLRDALGSALGRAVRTGFTHFRLTIPAYQADRFARLRLLAVTPLEEAVQRGKVKIAVDIQGEGISLVIFRLNGRTVQIANVRPFVWDWDTNQVPNGEHLVEVQGLDQQTRVISNAVRKVLVDN